MGGKEIMWSGKTHSNEEAAAKCLDTDGCIAFFRSDGSNIPRFFEHLVGKTSLVSKKRAAKRGRKNGDVLGYWWFDLQVACSTASDCPERMPACDASVCKVEQPKIDGQCLEDYSSCDSHDDQRCCGGSCENTAPPPPPQPINGGNWGPKFECLPY